MLVSAIELVAFDSIKKLINLGTEKEGMLGHTSTATLQKEWAKVVHRSRLILDASLIIGFKLPHGLHS